jgi:hypothetical protein
MMVYLLYYYASVVIGAVHHPLLLQNNGRALSLRRSGPRWRHPHIATAATDANTLQVQLVHDLPTHSPNDDEGVPDSVVNCTWGGCLFVGCSGGAIAARGPMSSDMTDDRSTCLPQSMASNPPPPSPGNPPCAMSRALGQDFSSNATITAAAAVPVVFDAATVGGGGGGKPGPR